MMMQALLVRTEDAETMAITTSKMAWADQDDAALIVACCHGQAQAKTVLCKRYLPFVYNVIMRTVQNTAMAEDLTQETFLRVFRALEQFDTHRPFKPWLVTIATNVTKTNLRKQQASPVVTLDDESDEAGSGQNRLENLADPRSWPPQEGFMDTVSQEALEAALNDLTPTIRQAMVLRHLHDFSYEDIAESLEANLNSVRTWLKRGRERLLKSLHNQLTEE